MAYTDQQVRDYLQQNLQGASDAQIAAEMARFGVDTTQMARATNVPVADVQSRFIQAITPPPGNSNQPTTTPQFTDADVRQYLLDRPGYTDAQIAADMIRFGVSPGQVARATQLPLADVQRRFDAIVNPLLTTLPGGPLTPVTPVTPVTPTTPLTPTTPTTTTSTMPPSVVPTPAISPAPGSVPAIGAALPGLPTQPAQYITPGGATTEPPAGVTPFALPMLNMRNLVNRGVVPSYVAVPQSTPQYAYQPITQIGTPIF